MRDSHRETGWYGGYGPAAGFYGGGRSGSRRTTTLQQLRQHAAPPPRAGCGKEEQQGSLAAYSSRLLAAARPAARGRAALLYIEDPTRPVNLHPASTHAQKACSKPSKDSMCARTSHRNFKARFMVRSDRQSDMLLSNILRSYLLTVAADDARHKQLEHPACCHSLPRCSRWRSAAILGINQATAVPHLREDKAFRA